MKKIWEAGLLLLALTGFWGMIYPDLCFTRDVCGVIYVREDNGEGRPQTDDRLQTDQVQMDRTQTDQVHTGQTRTDRTPAGGQSADTEMKDLFTQICEAKPEQIRIRFALTESLTEKKEGKGKEDAGKEEWRASP